MYSGSVAMSGITPPPSETLRPARVVNSEISESGTVRTEPSCEWE